VEIDKQRNMWKALKYLYYKLYKLLLRMNGEEDLPQITAMLAVGTLLIFNALAVLAIINIYFPFWDYPDIPRLKFYIVFVIPWALILYFTFVFKGKYKRIINGFKDETEKQRIRGKAFVIIYMFLSFCLTMVSLIIISLNR
jgi:hypothetical protein